VVDRLGPSRAAGASALPPLRPGVVCVIKHDLTAREGEPDSVVRLEGWCQAFDAVGPEAVVLLEELDQFTLCEF
jgi:hypothetical protein